MKKFLTVILLVYSLLLLACPAKTIERAEKESARLATYANTGVNVTRDLFEQGVIIPQRANDIAKAFSLLADAGIAFDLAVSKAKREYGSSVPKPEIDRLFAVFDAEVVGKFLGVLSALKVLSNVTAFTVLIESLKTAVLVIARAFGRRHQVEAKIA